MLRLMTDVLTSATAAFGDLAQLVASSPTAIFTLSAAVLVGVLVLTAARRTTRAIVIVRSRTDLRFRGHHQRGLVPVLVPQTDPDAAGRPRPRAPSRHTRTCA